MSFKEDHPKYKAYKSERKMYYADVPNSVWSPLESLIDEAGGVDREFLPRLVQEISTKSRAGNVRGGDAYEWIGYVVSKLRGRVSEPKVEEELEGLIQDLSRLLKDDWERTKAEISLWYWMKSKYRR